MKTLILTLLTVVSLTSPAAQSRTNDVATIFNLVQRFDQNCTQGILIESYSSDDLVKLPADLLSIIYQVAFDQAQIWGDTILEGDYVADGNMRLDEVHIIKQGDTVIGYALTYSERAWFTGDCAYNSTNRNSLEFCQEGRIQERSFVSADFQDVKVDQNQFAEFKAND